MQQFMIKSAILTASAMVIMASAGSGTTSPPPSATVLDEFSDGSGVARVTDTQNGESVTLTAMVPDVRTAVNEFDSDDSPVAVDLNNLTNSGSNAYGEFYTGTATINGQSVNVLAYVDDKTGATSLYAEAGGTNIAVAGGETVSNIPSGNYNYVGTNVAGARDGSWIDYGTFAMSVDFTKGAGNLTGSTTYTSIGGNFTVNTTTGNYSGNNLNLTVGSVSTDATIHGSFHGDGATGVTGLYYDNAANPSVAGAIVGSR